VRAFGYGRQTGSSEEQFFADVYRRLVANMVALLLVGFPAVWIGAGGAMALVFILGSAIAIINFHWLRRSIEAMGARYDRTGRAPSRAGIILRFVLRYLLIAAAAYVILKSTANSLNGLFFGLSLPVGAILIEAFYQVVAALRTRTLNPRN
jgi:hypothetical protein